MLLNLLNEEDFSSEVEVFSVENKTSIMDSILFHVEKKNIEFEIVPKLLSPRLKSLLELEVKKLNLIHKESSTLDI